LRTSINDNKHRFGNRQTQTPKGWHPSLLKIEGCLPFSNTIQLKIICDYEWRIKIHQTHINTDCKVVVKYSN
jgi:hypothetical protein